LDTQKTIVIVTVHDALEKLRSYCAYQERCHQEVMQKLRSFSLTQTEKDHIILLLIQGDYLNEHRFAEAYVSGKINIKRWGRNKIKQGLLAKGISAGMITSSLKTIDSELYFSNLVKLYRQKAALVKERSQQKRQAKIASYLLSKGYESNLVWEVIKDGAETEDYENNP
jgi:regulatory protein